MPKFRHNEILVDAVQWHDDNQTWDAVRALHADSELVAFRNPDGTVSIETADGRKDAEEGVWIVKHPDGSFRLRSPEGFSADYVGDSRLGESATT